MAGTVYFTDTADGRDSEGEPMTKQIKPDETRTMTLDEVRALPGMLGRIASVMVERHGSYGYTDTATGRKILILRA